MARPWGVAEGEVSGMVGRPVELEKRARMGMGGEEEEEEGFWKWGAVEREDASAEGVNVPFMRWPLA